MRRATPKLYTTREKVRVFWGESYAFRMGPWRTMVLDASDRMEVSPLEVLYRTLRDGMGAFGAAFLIAATLDVMEGIDESESPTNH